MFHDVLGAAVPEGGCGGLVAHLGAAAALDADDAAMVFTVFVRLADVEATLTDEAPLSRATAERAEQQGHLPKSDLNMSRSALAGGGVGAGFLRGLGGGGGVHGGAGIGADKAAAWSMAGGGSGASLGSTAAGR